MLTQMEKIMKNQEENTAKETSRIEKLKAEESKLLTKEQTRNKAYAARELEIEKAQKVKDTQRAEERAREEVRELAKEKTRKEAYLAREKIIAEEQESRKSKK